MRRIILAAALAALAALPAPARAASGYYCGLYGTGSKSALFLVDRTSGAKAATTKAVVGQARDFLLGKAVKDPARPGMMVIAGAMLRPGERVEISTVSDSVVSRKVIYSDCRPGREAGLSSWVERPIDPVTLSQHDSDFLAEAAAALDKATSTADSTRKSAIIDTLSKVSKTHKAGTLTRVVIVSDMLDNVTIPDGLAPKPKGAKGLQAMTEYQLRDALRTVQAKDAFARLKDAKIDVFGFGVDDFNKNALPPEASRMVEVFWNAYFELSGTDGDMALHY